MPDSVVLVHGIWMTGLELGLLARRLRDCGYRTVLFRYHSLLNTVAQNASLLRQRINELGNSRVHLVGHSLGGLVILQALQDQPDLVEGRIVLLGSPVKGSVIAQRLHRYRLSRWLIGNSGKQALLGGGPRWRGRNRWVSSMVPDRSVSGDCWADLTGLMTAPWRCQRRCWKMSPRRCLSIAAILACWPRTPSPRPCVRFSGREISVINPASNETETNFRRVPEIPVF